MTTSTSMKGHQIASEVDLIACVCNFVWPSRESLSSWNLNRDIRGLDALDAGFGHVGPGLGE
jgi:hypothetical protein